MQGTHWSGPACWYAGIIWALLAIVLGAQQSMVVPDACQSPEKISELRQKLMVGGHGRGFLDKHVSTKYGGRGVSQWVERSRAATGESSGGHKGVREGEEVEKGEGRHHHRHHHEQHHHERRKQPSHLVLFALQAPLMCLTYSIFFFLAGLASVVLSPLAHNPGWNADAKVRGHTLLPDLLLPL